MDFGHKDEHVDDEMVLIQANLDDMNPEWSPHIVDLLFAAGANDVYWIPIVMKKGRPAYMLNVLASSSVLDKVEEIVFRETTTLGVRWMHASCHRLEREFKQVSTSWGEVAVKIGRYKGKPVQFAPEFSDCERIAKQHGIALKEVYDAVRQQYRNTME